MGCSSTFQGRLSSGKLTMVLSYTLRNLEMFKKGFSEILFSGWCKSGVTPLKTMELLQCKPGYVRKEPGSILYGKFKIGRPFMKGMNSSETGQ